MFLSPNYVECFMLSTLGALLFTSPSYILAAMIRHNSDIRVKLRKFQ